jgi:2-C-methyl-D-erythritol 2,4-cyclodiphosphate synthase
MRVGFGFDIHRLVSERKLVLSGVEIPYVKGLLGHSDGDVIIHAMCDALLGAAGQGDIGQHFPDTDSTFKDVPSTVLLERSYHLIKERDFTIVNIDTVIVAEEPLIAPFRERMKKTVANILNIPQDRVNIKATTMEGLGFIGAGEAISAYAVVTLQEERRGGTGST